MFMIFERWIVNCLREDISHTLLFSREFVNKKILFVILFPELMWMSCELKDNDHIFLMNMHICSIEANAVCNLTPSDGEKRVSRLRGLKEKDKICLSCKELHGVSCKTKFKIHFHFIVSQTRKKTKRLLIFLRQGKFLFCLLLMTLKQQKIISSFSSFFCEKLERKTHDIRW